MECHWELKCEPSIVILQFIITSDSLDVKVSADIVVIFDPAMLMALTVMVYLLSSLRFLRVYIIMVPSVIFSVTAPPPSKHLLMV